MSDDVKGPDWRPAVGSNTWRDHETDPDLVWMDVSTSRYPGMETLVDRDMLPTLTARGRWVVERIGPGKPNSEFYVARGRLRLHRAVLGLVRGDGVTTSHLNHNTLDNRRSNLEATSTRLNIRHGQRGAPVLGYHRAKKKWRAQVRIDGACVRLGRFTDEQSAAARYAEANKIIDGAALAGVTLTEAGFRD